MRAVTFDVEWVEDHDLVDPVDELGAEGLFERLERGGLEVDTERLLVGVAETHARADGVDLLDAEVARQDHQRLAEGGGLSLAVGEHALVEQLQQQVVHLGVGLLDFVEQDHAVLLLAHGFGEEAALAVPDVTGGGEPMSLAYSCGSAYSEQSMRTRRPGVVVERSRDRLGQLGLAGAGAAHQEERAHWRSRWLEPDRGLLDGAGQGRDRFVLADDLGAQRLLEAADLAIHTLSIVGAFLGRQDRVDSVTRLRAVGQRDLVDLQGRVDVDADLVEQLFDDLEVVVLVESLERRADLGLEVWNADFDDTSSVALTCFGPATARVRTCVLPRSS